MYIFFSVLTSILQTCKTTTEEKSLIKKVCAACGSKWLCNMRKTAQRDPAGEWRGRGPRPRRRARSRSPAAEASERREGKPAAAGRTERGPRSRWGSGPAGETPAKGERTRPQPLSEPAFREVGMGARPRMERSRVEMGPRGDMAPELCTHRVNKSLALIGLL